MVAAKEEVSEEASTTTEAVAVGTFASTSSELATALTVIRADLSTKNNKECSIQDFREPYTRWSQLLRFGSGI